LGACVTRLRRTNVFLACSGCMKYSRGCVPRVHDSYQRGALVHFLARYCLFLRLSLLPAISVRRIMGLRLKVVDIAILLISILFFLLMLLRRSPFGKLVTCLFNIVGILYNQLLIRLEVCILEIAMIVDYLN